MAKRYSGRVTIEVKHDGQDNRDLSREQYKVTVMTSNGSKWRGIIGASLRELGGSVDASTSYDAIAKSALAFAASDEDCIRRYGRDWLDSASLDIDEGYQVSRTPDGRL